MKLYELTTEYQTLADAAASAGPDDAQAFLDTLEGIAGEVGHKLLACARVYRTLEAEAEAVGTEAARLAARRSALLANAKHLKAYMQRGMEAVGAEKFKDDLFTIAMQNNAPSVVLNSDDASKLPRRFQRIETTVDANRKDLAAALKAGDAEAMQYARLEVTRGIRIK